MNRLLTLFILFSGIYTTQAQPGSVTGVVTGDGAALEVATVSILKTPYAASTDSNGYFKLTDVPAGKYQIRITYVGYENYQDEVVVDTIKAAKINIALVPLASRLKEVVVTGTMKEVRKLESVTPVDVYTAPYFQRNPSSNVYDAISGINGLYADVDNGVSNTTDVQINGLEGNYTMYLIDGVPAMSGLAGAYAINALPIALVDKIEVVKGASSSLYGSDAIAGVINIKTKSPLTAPRFSMNVSLTSMLETDADFAVRYKIGKAQALFAVSGETFNQRWDINNDGFIDVPLVNRVNLYNKWTIPRADKKAANFYIRYLYEDRLGGQLDYNHTYKGSSYIYGEAVTTNQWQMGTQYQLPTKEKIMLMADYSESRQNSYYGVNNYKGIQLTGFAQLTWNKQIGKHNELLAGTAYRLQYFEDNSPLSADSLTGYNRVLHIPALFVEDEISFAKYHKLIIGFRAEYSNRGKFVPIPRINYKWNSKKMTDIVRVGIGTGYRIPNVFYEGIGAMNGSRTIVVAEKLNPEYVVSANANYTRVQEVNGGLLNIDASVFYTYFTNYVEPDYEEDPSLIVYSNNHGATATGFSINADFSFNFPLKTGIGLTYTYVYELDENDDGEIVKQTPLHQPPVVANFYLSYNFPAPQLSIDWTGNMVAPMLLSSVPNDFRPEKSPFYTIQNIQLTKKFKQGIEIYAGIKNIFNFVQKDPILRPNDPFNSNTGVDNPNNYRFDTTYGFTSTQGIKGFAGIRYTLQ